MLVSLALMVLCGFALGGLMQRWRLPPLLGMMAAGILLGPYVLNWIDPSILNISADLRQMALIVILIRAGLALDLDALKKVGRPAILMCFVPASFELVGVLLLAPRLLGVTYLEAAIMGAVLAAVSPAVVVPRMLRLMESGHGQEKNIPQLIMAGASVDDVYVIVLFTSFTGMAQGASFDVVSLAGVPISILLGLGVGILAGLAVIKLFSALTMGDTVKVLVLLGVAFLLVSLENALKGLVPLSGLLGVMALGGTILKGNQPLARQLSGQYAKIWVGAELMLFVLVGAAVNIRYIGRAGSGAVLLILGALAFRMAGVFCCVLKTKLNRRERLFTAIAYLPKATVQAAIGGIPLAQGMAAGELILTVAVLAILITAPLGAIGMDMTYRRLLTPPKGEAE